MLASERVSGLILAGGAGRRVAGRDKGLLPWRGEPIVASVARRLRPQVDELFLSCNRNRQRYQNFADRVFVDKLANYQGPLAGLDAARSQIKTSFLVVVACDTPLLPKDLAQRLLQPLLDVSEDSPRLSFAYDGERDQYLFAAMDIRCLQTLPQYLRDGERKLGQWLKSFDYTRVDFSDCPKNFANMNSLAAMK